MKVSFPKKESFKMFLIEDLICGTNSQSTSRIIMIFSTKILEKVYVLLLL